MVRSGEALATVTQTVDIELLPKTVNTTMKSAPSCIVIGMCGSGMSDRVEAKP